MHLGRFHSVIYDLAHHFRTQDTNVKFETAVQLITQFSSQRDDETLANFKRALSTLLDSCEVNDPDLEQPYARDVIKHLELEQFMGSNLSDSINAIISKTSYDPGTLAKDLKTLQTKLSDKTVHVTQIDDSFTKLYVEWERVHDGQCELGLILPRESVGNTLTELTSEFAKHDKLFRGINELTGAKQIDPVIQTISSSAWQLFIEIDAVSVSAWVFAIERIVQLIKANLDIKKAQKDLVKLDVSPAISDMLTKEISDKVAAGIAQIANEMRKEFAVGEDENRKNEIEIQIRQGLSHLAKRINEGAEIEINVSLPKEPEEPKQEEGASPIPAELKAEIELQKTKIAQLRELRAQARVASAQTLQIQTEEKLLLEFVEPEIKE